MTAASRGVSFPYSSVGMHTLVNVTTQERGNEKTVLQSLVEPSHQAVLPSERSEPRDLFAMLVKKPTAGDCLQANMPNQSMALDPMPMRTGLLNHACQRGRWRSWAMLCTAG